MEFPIQNGGSFHSYVSLPEGTIQTAVSSCLATQKAWPPNCRIAVLKDQQRTALFPGAASGVKVYFPRSFVRLLGKEVVPFQYVFHDTSCSYLTCQDIHEHLQLLQDLNGGSFLGTHPTISCFLLACSWRDVNGVLLSVHIQYAHW